MRSKDAQCKCEESPEVSNVFSTVVLIEDTVNKQTNIANRTQNKLIILTEILSKMPRTFKP